MHEIPDLDAPKESGGVRRMVRYDQLTSHLLGPVRGKWCLLPFQICVLFGTATLYIVAGGQDLHAFANHVNADQGLPVWGYYVVFTCLQLVLSMLPTFAELSLVSLLGALMSIGYSLIAIAMCFTVERAEDVSYDPTHGKTGKDVVMSVFNALTTLLFAFGERFGVFVSI